MMHPGFLDQTISNSRLPVLVGMVLAFVTVAPLLFIQALYWDDWAWLWVFKNQGSHMIQEYMWQAAHPTYGLVLNAFLWLGGDAPGPLARTVSIVFHLSNGYLIWLVFRKPTNEFGIIISCLYLAAPFVGLRHTLSHVQYDIFIFFYLASILLSSAHRLLFQAISMACLVIGLGIEPLAALEPIRWWYIYQNNKSVRQLVFKSTPHIILIILYLISRITWLVPYGHFSLYNNMGFDISLWPSLLRPHLVFFPNTFRQLLFISQLWETEIIIGLILAVVCFIITFLSKNQDFRNDRLRLALLFGSIGVIVTVLGIIPYIIINRYPSWFHYHSRFSVASQFGALLLFSSCIFAISQRIIRPILFGTLIFVFATLQIQFSKWALFQDKVLEEFRAEMTGYLRENGNELLSVRFLPSSRDIMYRWGHLDVFDLNAWFDIAGKRNGSILFDYDSAHTFQNIKCTISAHDYQRCPEKFCTIEYILRPESDHFFKLSFAQLVTAKLNGSHIKFGNLTNRRCLSKG